MSRSLLSLLLLSLIMSACGDDGGQGEGSCAETLCEVGETRCLGNVLATCEKENEESPGLWRYETCGSSKACTAGPSGQSCETRKCTNLGSGTCLDAETLYVCDVSGLSNTAQDCAAEELCSAGICAPSACEEGESRCGAGSILLCSGGSWTLSECAADELCDLVEGVGTCGPQLCEPESAWCDEGVAKVCDHRGAEIASTPCADSEVCHSGFCETLLCSGENNVDPGSGQSTADVLGTEAMECEPGETHCLDKDSLQTCDGGLWIIGNCGPNEGCSTVDDIDQCKAKAAPPLEKIGVILFTLAGVPNTFDLNARADYISAESMLKIAGASGTRKIELNFAPIEPMVVGQFSDTGLTETVLTVCYYDGSLVTESPSCSVGFSHSSSLYTAVIDQWNGVGSSVVGTFETTLETMDGSQLAITAGSFDVKQK